MEIIQNALRVIARLLLVGWLGLQVEPLDRWFIEKCSLAVAL